MCCPTENFLVRTLPNSVVSFHFTFLPNNNLGESNTKSVTKNKYFEKYACFNNFLQIHTNTQILGSKAFASEMSSPVSVLDLKTSPTLWCSIFEFVKENRVLKLIVFIWIPRKRCRNIKFLLRSHLIASLELTQVSACTTSPYLDQQNVTFYSNHELPLHHSRIPFQPGNVSFHKWWFPTLK